VEALRAIPQIANVRGKGLMIGFDVPAGQGELRKRLLLEQGVFTGEAKGGVVRLLPSLALGKADADIFLEKLNAALLK
jgi:acetylornithine aminotransferase